jgi:excisionase family DNA binding protein
MNMLTVASNPAERHLAEVCPAHKSGDERLAYRVGPFCQSIGIGRTKFYELLGSGKIKTIMIGGRRLIPADEAQRLVREGCE